MSQASPSGYLPPRQCVALDVVWLIKCDAAGNTWTTRDVSADLKQRRAILEWRSPAMEHFKTRIVQQRAGNFGRSAKWSWDVYQLRRRNLKIVGCGTCEDEASARDAGARALADFLETETWGNARRRA